MCASHPEPLSQLPLHPNPQGCPIAPALGAPPMIALALFLFLPSQNYSPPNSHESYQVFPHLKPSRGISSILNAGQGLRGLVSHTSSQISLLKYLNVAICRWGSRHPRLLPGPRTSHANSTSQMLVTATDAKNIKELLQQLPVIMSRFPMRNLDYLMSLSHFQHCSPDLDRILAPYSLYPLAFRIFTSLHFRLSVIGWKHL